MLSLEKRDVSYDAVSYPEAFFLVIIRSLVDEKRLNCSGRYSQISGMERNGNGNGFSCRCLGKLIFLLYMTFAALSSLTIVPQLNLPKLNCYLGLQDLQVVCCGIFVPGFTSPTLCKDSD